MFRRSKWIYLPRTEFDKRNPKTWCDHEDQPHTRSTGYKGSIHAEIGAVWRCKCGKKWMVDSISTSGRINWEEFE